ncbi:hypothetical protein AHMF7605_26660 [Adhaeribacter arboris]|uniref:PNPLA domain-containing protein n=1 Tax=Adhaeribacter arboris TaxID=2072846 RepID=A0A2T2YMT7_9BACT|nr:patatin-like phospholipase family protein [Adhaeribacter arboris]PSR56823.1 hypothetical protein AHMF7605_26660 [Adhaeribacter arboris]
MKNFYFIGILIILLFCQNILLAQSPVYNNRILVVGGGGARGAWGAGFAKHLTEKYKGSYKTVYGTSTGSLMAPLIVLNDFVTLKTAYTSVTQRSIFNVNPFNRKTGELKKVPAFFRLLIGKKTFGESKNLRKLIDQFVSLPQYQQIRNSPDSLHFTVTVVDLKTGKPDYKSSNKIADFEQMKNWMWASGNEPLFMSYYPKKGPQAYVDGGVLENVPLKEALRFAIKNANIQDIDVIINKPIHPLVDTTFRKRGILQGLTRLIDLWSIEIRDDDTLIPQLVALAVNNQLTRQLVAAVHKTNGETISLSKPDSINIHLYYFPPELFTKLNQKELLLDKKRMTEMWEAGEAGKEDPNPKFDISSLINPQILNSTSHLMNLRASEKADQPITIPKALLENFLNGLK